MLKSDQLKKHSMLEHETSNEVSLKATLETIPRIPLIVPGDNLGEVLKNAIDNSNICLQDKDVLVIAQKIVSKAEGRVVSLTEYIPSKQAIEISQKSGKDPRLVQLILNESQEVRWVMDGTSQSPGIIVVKHHLGHVCSGAGIDTSNTGSADKDSAILLPEDPDSSAKRIADYFSETSGLKIGVMVIDTLGDRNRIGSIGKAIGVANVPARVVENGLSDLDGKQMLLSDVAFADSLAGLAMILMGNPNGGSPVVLIRGVDYPFTPTAKIRDVFI